MSDQETSGSRWFNANGDLSGLSLIIATFGVLVITIGALWGIGQLFARTTPPSGEIAVVRNGSAFLWPPDWFDNHRIRQVVPNGSGSTARGMGSDTHYYPVTDQQRFIRMESCVDGNDNTVPCDNADTIAPQQPTADGVEVTIEGTFYLNTVFDDSPVGEKMVKQFDTQFATRTFGGKHPYDGTQGWKNFLTAIVEPVIQNNLRSSISGITCAELLSSCALVQNSGNLDFATTKQLALNKINQSNVQKVEDAINRNLTSDLKTTLGGEYFKNIRFNVTNVTLPAKVQDAIDTAQASFAAVSKAQADVSKARLEARANKIKQSGYLKCPACARIDALKELPKNLQALGGNLAFSVNK